MCFYGIVSDNIGCEKSSESYSLTETLQEIRNKWSVFCKLVLQAQFSQ